jgi:hypothetical protein
MTDDGLFAVNHIHTAGRYSAGGAGGADGLRTVGAGDREVRGGGAWGEESGE